MELSESKSTLAATVENRESCEEALPCLTSMVRRMEEVANDPKMPLCMRREAKMDLETLASNIIGAYKFGTARNW
jgi:hypothetical protein